MSTQLAALPRTFKVGQVWEPRRPSRWIGDPDHWVIEAITNHPRSPVIARSACDAIRCFSLNGICDGDDDISDLDLVTLVKDVP